MCAPRRLEVAVARQCTGRLVVARSWCYRPMNGSTYGLLRCIWCASSTPSTMAIPGTGPDLGGPTIARSTASRDLLAPSS
jgi:hypothetical protein